MKNSQNVTPAGANISRALVLGATGTVGARLAEVLQERGAEVLAFCRSQQAVALVEARGYTAKLGHLGDPESIASAAVGCDVAFHCAGDFNHGADGEALKWIHIAGVENVVAGCRAAGVRRLVLLSCADVRLQNRDRIHIREDQPLIGRPLGAWARTKLIGEEVALQASSPSLEVTAIRPGYLWGRGDRCNLPQLCREVQQGGIQLFGSGNGLFSAAHLGNVVHGMLLAADAELAPGQAFHICDGEYETSSEFFDSLSAALGAGRPRRSIGTLNRASALTRGFLRRGSGDMRGLPEVVRRGRACLLDMQRAINDLGYKPVVTRADGLADLAQYVAELGGLEPIAAQERLPAGASDVAEFERLAMLDV